MISIAAAALRQSLEAAGHTVDSVRLERVEPRQGGEICGFNVRLDGAAEPVLIYVDTSSAPVPQVAQPDKIDLVEVAELPHPARVWRYPYDPDLPALPTATYPHAAEEVLSKVGWDPDVVKLTMMSYRPSRRAVVRVDQSTGVSYLKIVRPEQVQDLVQVHANFRAAGVGVPRVLAWSADGLLLLENVPGVPASQCVAELAEDNRFTDALNSLVNEIGEVATTIVAKPGAWERVHWYRDMLCHYVPDRADVVVAIADEIDRQHLSRTDEPMTRHGDLHLDQVLVDPEDPHQLTGLIDIDTAGIAHVASDAATFVADLVVRAVRASVAGDEESATAHTELADRVYQTCAPWPADIAAQLLAHALGPAVEVGDVNEETAARLIDAARRFVIVPTA